MTSKEKKANSCYEKELNDNAKYIEKYIKYMYSIAGRFGYESISKYSYYNNIYEIDLDNIFEKIQKDDYGRLIDTSTSEVYALLSRTYKLIIIGIHMIEAETADIKDQKTPVGTQGISITNMVMLIILNNINTLLDIANSKQGFKFGDSKFCTKYKMVIAEINKSKCIEEIIKKINIECIRIGTWSLRHPTVYTIQNLYIAIKHGFEPSDFFERNDRQKLIDNIEKHSDNVTNGMTETIWFNDKCKETLKVCKVAFEHNLCVLNDLLK